MKEIFFFLRKYFDKIFNIIKKNNKLRLTFIVKFSIAISIISFLTYLFFLKKNKRISLSLVENIGYLRLIKKNVAKLFQNKFIKIHDIYSYPNGLTNFGNNCYINVLLNCLASTPEFIIFIASYLEYGKMNDKNYEILKELYLTLDKINSDKTIISPWKIVKILNTQFSFAFEQQDSYELFHRIFDLIDEKYNYDCNPFIIELQKTYICERCYNVFQRNEKCYDLSLSPFHNSDLLNLISDSFKDEYINDYLCSKCTILDVIKQIDLQKIIDLDLIKLRNYLRDITKGYIEDLINDLINNIINFCKQNNLNVLDKLSYAPIKSKLIKKTKIIKFPKILAVHITKVYFQEEVITNKFKLIFPEKLIFEGNINYEMVSFLEHLGSHNFGHYISYRKFFDKWIFINDIAVRLTTKENVLSCSNPYMLFYRIK